MTDTAAAYDRALHARAQAEADVESARAAVLECLRSGASAHDSTEALRAAEARLGAAKEVEYRALAAELGQPY